MFITWFIKVFLINFGTHAKVGATRVSVQHLP